MQQDMEIPVELFDPNPENARRALDDAASLALGHDMIDRGLLVPLIGYAKEAIAADKGARRYMLVDGHRRLEGAKRVGIKTLRAAVLSEAPSAAKLHILQMSLEAHRVGLSAIERSDLLRKIQDENSWSVNELAANLHIKQPLVSKYLSASRLCIPAREALHAGTIDLEKAGIIAAEPDPATQLELLKAATECSREQLRRRARGVTSEPKTSSAKFAMPDGYTVSLSGPPFDLSVAADVFSNAASSLKKGLSQRLSLDSQIKVMRDRAKAGGK